MKYKILAFIAIVFVFMFATVAKAQGSTPSAEPFDFNKAYQDYVFILDQYQKDHSDYLLARAQYLQAGTLLSQTNAQEATAKMLESRDDVVVAYLTAVRMRLSESVGISDTVKNGLFDRIDVEIAWYKDHKSKISSAGTLNDLVGDSNSAKNRFDSTQPLIYEVISTIPIGKLDVMRSQLNDILTRLKNKTSEIRSNGDLDTQIVERWLIETDDKFTRSVDKESSAQVNIAKFPASTSQQGGIGTNLEGNYNTIITLVQESHQFLRDASSYMQQIIKGLTTI